MILPGRGGLLFPLTGLGEGGVRSSTLKSLMPAFFILMLGLAGAGAATLYPADNAGVVAVVLAPGASLGEAAAVAARADAALVRTGALPNIWIVASSQPGLAARLHRAGVWLVIDAIAGGCGGAPIPVVAGIPPKQV